MSKSKNSTFDASLQLDGTDEEAKALAQRRIATYSVEALRAANTVDKIFVQHGGFTTAVRVLDRLFQLGTELDMPQGARLVGPTGVGKTAVFRFFQESQPKSSLISPGLGAIGLRVPQSPRTGHFIAGILRAIKYPFATGSGKQLYQRRPLIFEALQTMGTRLIWLDEAQHLIRQPKGSGLRDWENESTEFLRELMDETRISLVLAGTVDLDNLDQAASHLASRVTVREELKDFHADANWVGFVRAFVNQCGPFDISFLSDPAIVRRLHLATDGNLRSFKRLVTEAVLLAIDAGKLSLDQMLLKQAFNTIYGTAVVRRNSFE